MPVKLSPLDQFNKEMQQLNYAHLEKLDTLARNFHLKKAEILADYRVKRLEIEASYKINFEEELQCGATVANKGVILKCRRKALHQGNHKPE